MSFKNNWKISYVLILISLIVLGFLTTLLLNEFPKLREIKYLGIVLLIFIALLSGFIGGYVSPENYKKAIFAAGLTIFLIGGTISLFYFKAAYSVQAEGWAGIILVLILFAIAISFAIGTVIISLFMVIGAILGSLLGK